MRQIAIVLLFVAAQPAWAQLHVRVTAGLGNLGISAPPPAVASIGDVDGDGSPDLCVGTTLAGPTNLGVRYLSGRTGALIRNVAFPAGFTYSTATAIAGLGDVNGDGIPDVAVGSMTDPVGALSSAGRVRIFSGAAGALLRTINGLAVNDCFGAALAAVGDLNGDGIGDLIVGAPQSTAPCFGAYPGNGYVQAISGATGAVLYTLSGPGLEDFFGASLSRMGDVDGDGVEDFAVGAPEQVCVTDNTPIFPSTGGYVRLVSGASGATIWNVGLTQIVGPTANHFAGFGYAIGTVGDVNGDGIADLGVGAPLEGPPAPGVRILSGTNGALIATLLAPANISLYGDALFGASVAGAGDVNGDGVRDVVIGAPFAYHGTGYDGSAFIYSASGTVLGSVSGALSARLGIAVAGIGDPNGDGFSEVAVLSSFEPGNHLGVLRVVGAAVAEPFMAPGVVTPLTLGWTHGTGSTGTIGITGAPPAAPGLLVASANQTTTTVFGASVLVDLTPGAFISTAFTYGPLGTLSFPVDLRSPGTAGLTVYVQAAALGPPVPLVSGGLMLGFSH